MAKRYKKKSQRLWGVKKKKSIINYYIDPMLFMSVDDISYYELALRAKGIAA